KMTATEKYEGQDADDIAIMPLAIPMITGPGAITSAIVLMNEAMSMDAEVGMNLVAIAVVPLAAVTAIGITYYMMQNADLIVRRIGQREYRAVNRLMGMLLIAIAVQFIIIGIRTAFPILTGG